MDAITVLKDDHKTVKKLFRQAEKAEGAELQQLALQIIDELERHTRIEEEVFYPSVRQEAEDLDDTVLESYEEHRLAKLLCSELREMQPDEESYEAKLTVLMEMVQHHVEEEEQEMFPQVREALGRKRLQELGQQLLEAKESAPQPA